MTRYVLYGVMLVLLVGIVGRAAAVPIIVESGWTLTRTVAFDGAQAAHYNRLDGQLYVGRRSSNASNREDGVYRINADGSATKVADGDRVATVVVGPDGDIFFSEDFGGRIYRIPFGSRRRATWVAGFHRDDDDPVGMAIATATRTGGILAPGDALVVDRGFNGPDEVWRFSSRTPEGEMPIHRDDGTLIDAVDIAMGTGAVYLVDGRGALDGAIYQLHADGSLTPLVTSEPIAEPQGIIIDPLTGDLFVLDADANRLVRVDPDTGDVRDMFTGFSFSTDAVGTVAWAGVDVSPNGVEIFLTDRGARTIYTFTCNSQPCQQAVLRTDFSLGFCELDDSIFCAPHDACPYCRIMFVDCEQICAGPLDAAHNPALVERGRNECPQAMCDFGQAGNQCPSDVQLLYCAMVRCFVGQFNPPLDSIDGVSSCDLSP